MISLKNQLEVDRCPHCQVKTPNLFLVWNTATADHSGSNSMWWKIYKCNTCGCLVSAYSRYATGSVENIYPSSDEVDESIPPKAKTFLEQALESLHSPAAAIMVAASAVDAMLKNKNYKSGNLYDRINKAATDHLITKEMAQWAHQVRLDANDQRHVDEDASIPNMKDAEKVVSFALALGEFLFVLPTKVNKGLKESQPAEKKQ